MRFTCINKGGNELFTFPGRKFVSILMRFWYLTSARLPEDSMEGTRIFQMAIGEGEPETKRLLTAIYEWVSFFNISVHFSVTWSHSDVSFYLSDRFQREFTKGVPPDWTITRIEHSKLLDWGGAGRKIVTAQGYPQRGGVRHSSSTKMTKLDLSTIYLSKDTGANHSRSTKYHLGLLICFLALSWRRN